MKLVRQQKGAERRYRREAQFHQVIFGSACQE